MKNTAVKRNLCPRCGSGIMKSRRELTANERFHAERMISADEQFFKENRRISICPKCWFQTSAATAEC